MVRARVGWCVAAALVSAGLVCVAAEGRGRPDGCAPQLTAASSGAATDCASDTLEAVLAALVDARRRAGRSPLVRDRTLDAAAAVRADDMVARRYFGHVGPDGQTPLRVIAASGYRYARAGENLARGMADGDAIVRAWLRSAAHRRNVLEPSYRHVGLARRGDIVVALFGAPRNR